MNRWCLTLAVAFAALLAPSLASAELNFNIQPSRCESAGETCAAPLAVMFRTDISDANFLEWGCDWDFGDSHPISGGSSEWRNGKRKNQAQGPIALHVYEGAGSFDVQLQCQDVQGDTGTDTARILVDSGDDVWSGSSTVCVSNNSDFSGCPAGADRDNTSQTGRNFDAIMTAYAAPGRRILLRRGGTWSSSAGLGYQDLPGPTMIGAFGSGAKPRINRTSASHFLRMEGLKDWRFADLEFVGNGSGDGQNILFCIQGECHYPTDPIEDMLILRVDSSGFTSHTLSTPDGMTAPAHIDFFLVGPADVRVTAPTRFNGIWGTTWGGGLIDHAISNGFHNVRYMCFRNTVWQHNNFNGGGAESTIRGCEKDRNGSRRGVVSDNVINEPMKVPATDPGTSGPMSTMVFERNFMNMGGGANQVQVNGAVFRNNVCKTNNTCFQVINEGGRSASDVRFYNNSFYNGGGGGGSLFVARNDSGASGIQCRNNLVTGSGASPAICDSSATQSDNIYTSSSPFVVSNPTSPEHFTLNSGFVSAIDVSPPLVVEDYFGTSRPLDGDFNGSALADVGAIEAAGQSGGPPANLNPPVLLD